MMNGKSQESPNHEKKRILICEDEKGVVDKLREDLGDFYSIEHCESLPELINLLEDKKKDNILPDILLLDLFWKKEGATDEERNRVSKYADETFPKQVHDFKKTVDEALVPRGILYLNLIREEFSEKNLPILIYTRGGPYILDEYQIEQIYEHKAYFLLKYYDPALKDYLIKCHINTFKIQHDVFISYASQDANIAFEIKEKLERENLNVFVAQKSIRAGEIWTERIRKAITSSKIILLLLTPNSIDSDWVKAEAGAGWAMQKIVVPVSMLIDTRNVPIVVSQFQMRPGETEKDRSKLIDEVYQLSQE